MIVGKFKDIDGAIRRLRKRGEAWASSTGQGLKKAGLALQRASQKVVPIDTANLKNSAFTRASGEGFSMLVRVGYTANYAVYVHENKEAHHAEGKQAKYLEGPAREMQKELLQIVTDEAKRRPKV